MSESSNNDIPFGESGEIEDRILKFINPIPHDIADVLLLRISNQLLPELQEKNPNFSVNPLFNKRKELKAIDFMAPLGEEFKEEIVHKIRKFIDEIIDQQQKDYSEEGFSVEAISDKMTSFTELLGTYRVPVVKSYIPIFICIFSAMFLSWLTTYQAEVEINAALIDPEEESVWGIILNGLVPVVISALVITVIWFAVKKYGLKVFKYIMGVMVLFYDWYGFIFYEDVIYSISWNWMSQTNARAWTFLILYHVLRWGLLAYGIYLGRKFFKNQLSDKTKNILVLFFGIFLGSIIGMSFPTWTTIAFALFLSIWDLITVFKGPLGKIADLVMSNRAEIQDFVEKQVEQGNISEEEAEQMGVFGSVQDEEFKDLKVRDYIKDINIELGSGDLILYSALVAHAFVKTLDIWVTVLTIVGVLLGMVLTLYMLFKKKRVLPALPFSMVFGIICFLSSAFALGYL